MSLTAVNLPVPTADGVGAAQSTAGLGADKAVVIGGTFNPSDASVIVEASGSAAGDDFCQVAVARQPTVVQLSVVAQRMRIRVTGLKVGSTFAPNADVAAESATPTFATITAPAGDGVGASVDVSALPDIRTVFVTGTFTGAVVLEGSQDDVDFVQVYPSIVSNRCIDATSPVRFLRIRRVGVVAAAPGLPAVEIGGVGQDSSSVPIPLNVGAGAVGAPSIYFGDSDTGLYAPAAGELAVTANGIRVADFSEAGIGFPSDPTFTNASIHAIGDADTGLLHDGTANTLYAMVGGFTPMFWRTAGASSQTVITGGSLANPSLVFSGDADTGFASLVAQTVSVVVNGTQHAIFSGVGGNLQQRNPFGVVGSPSYSFNGRETVGLWSSAANTLDVATNGTTRLQVDATVSAGNTALLVSVAGAAPTRVSVGANDSGGLGFRYLRVPN